MGKIIVRKKRENDSPYEIPGLAWNVYSPEELVYSYYQNLYLIEKSVMDRRLPDWLRSQGETRLAKQLETQLNKPEADWNMEAFVGLVLEGIPYYTQEEIDRAKAVMAEWSQADPYMRRKERLDFFLGERRLYEAVNGYETLLEDMEAADYADQASFQAAVWHNLGVAYGRLFLFDQAAEAFGKAWKLSAAGDSKELYMLSLRMSLPKKDYVNRIAEERLGEEEAMDLEEKLLKLLKKEEQSEKRLSFEAMKQQKELGNQAFYESSLKKMVSSFRNRWRNGNGDF